MLQEYGGAIKARQITKTMLTTKLLDVDISAVSTKIVKMKNT